MMANIESSVSLEEENSNSLTLTTISEAKKLDANLSKPENAAIARKPKRTKILISWRNFDSQRSFSHDTD